MTRPLEEAALHERLRTLLPHASVADSWGETGYFHNPGNQLKRGVYICTVKSRDGENDAASKLNREGVYRLNIGLPKSEFASLFQAPPPRPANGETVQGPWDFTTLDTVLPHPVYAWMGWVCVLSPSQSTFERCEALISSAARKAEIAFDKRVGRK